MNIGRRDPSRARGRPPKIQDTKRQIRSAILQGHIKRDEQLPALGELARQLKVGRVTAKRAVDELAKEGWLESRHGVGTFVRVRRSGSQVMLTAPRQFGNEPFLRSEHIESFHALHPNVRITLSSEPITDIVVTNSYALVCDRLRAQNLRSLDALGKELNRATWELPDFLRRLGSWEETLFGLPMRADLILLQANLPLLKKVGLELTRPYLEWSEFVEIMKRCREDRDGDGFVECAGAFSKFALYEWLIPFWQRGGRLDDREAFFNPKAFSVLDELWQMHHVDRTMPPELAVGQGDFSNKVLARRFEREQSAVRWIPSARVFERTPFPAAALLPRFGPLPRQEVHALLLGIHRESAHPDIALEFLDFCHRQFVRDNQEYPFALTETERLLLRQMPVAHRLFEEGLTHATEPLQEGVPQRTWALESEIYEWLRLLQNKQQMISRLHEHWDRWEAASKRKATHSSAAIVSWSEVMSPVGQLVHGEEP